MIVLLHAHPRSLMLLAVYDMRDHRVQDHHRQIPDDNKCAERDDHSHGHRCKQGIEQTDSQQKDQTPVSDRDPDDRKQHVQTYVIIPVISADLEIFFSFVVLIGSHPRHQLHFLFIYHTAPQYSDII